MIASIKLFNHKGLKECELNNLGKINVICGKNNSGKTTILEAIKQEQRREIVNWEQDIEVINREQHREFGIKFSQKEYYDIIKLGMKSIKNGMVSIDSDKDRNNVKLLNDLLERLNSQYNSEIIWFEDSINDFINECRQKATMIGIDIDNNVYRNFIIDINEAYSKYFGEFNKRIKICLIYPKRQLELNREVYFNQPVWATGSGILNNLFSLKNKLPNSDEYKTYQKIEESFKEISSGYVFDIKSSVISTDANRSFLELYFMYNDQWRKAKNYGLGLRDLLVILYFSIIPKYNTILIEEPENHIHPEMQRKLLYFLKNKTDKQFFISTHSNVFLDYTMVDKIYLTHCDNSIHIENATNKAEILHNLGYSITDNLIADLVILVEGPTDKPILEEFLIKMGIWDKHNIKIWPLGGDIMAQLDLSVFVDKSNTIALIDCDPKSSKIRNRFKRNCENIGIECHKLKGYAIENYFTMEAIKKVLGKNIDEDIYENLKKLDSKKKVEKQLGINVKNNNRKITKAMSLSDIKGTDLYEFLEKVKSICKNELIKD